MTDLYYNAKFFVGGSFADAVLVEDGRFVFVGGQAETFARHTGGAIVDLHGAMVVPGFNDSHMHLYGMAFVMERLALQDVTSVGMLQEKLRAYLHSPAYNGDFIAGRGFNQDFFDVKAFPTKADLDQVSKDIPIIVTRVCGHIAIANTAALLRSNIDESTLIDGGEIDFHTGLLTEKALGCLFTSDLGTTKDEVRRLLIKGMDYANRYGVTTLQTDDLMHAFPADFEKMIEVYRELDEQGLLTVRIRAQSNLPTLELLKKYIAKGYPNKVYSDRLKMGPLKILTDGTLGARTAAMSAPYKDDPATKGLLTYTDEELYDLVKTAHLANMSVAMHAIGDRALTQVLDAYERVLNEYPRKDHRHTIIHCQITTKAILERMARLGVYAAVQPVFIDVDMNVVKARVGNKLAMTSYAWKTMQDLGINVAIGTDAPVEDVNPFENIRTAVYRSNQSGRVYNRREKMSVADAILAYTKYSARQTRDENELGEIKVGHYADFAVLNRNVFKHLKNDAYPKRAMMTFLGGKRVY
ncbi:MAG TPA: hypothetical protein DCR44_05920 [Acholeplasmatales bacterium]|nr:MAG: hypothetical protein A2Y16_06150 [Tenericutes bacterium GWF2_57_13]HAQ56915.1 hypothetical protein [Acholeplasmatales bacterium]